MIQVIWTYRVRQESLRDFERYYNPEGVWAEWFRSSPEYRGTELLRDREDPLRFATVDQWDSWEAYDTFLREHRAEYEHIDMACAEMTTEEARVGVFDG